MKKSSGIIKIVGVLGLVAILGGCAMFSGRETTGQYVDDAAITSKVKANILGEPTLKVLQVNVETMQGVVQLSGFVDSKKSEAKAVEIARNVDGVKSVKDDLIVR